MKGGGSFTVSVLLSFLSLVVHDHTTIVDSDRPCASYFITSLCLCNTLLPALYCDVDSESPLLIDILINQNWE